MNLPTFWVAVFDYCRMTNGSVVSGVRSHSHNAARGGPVDSPHVFGLAADVVYDHADPYERRQRVAGRFGLAIELREGYDHLQPLDWA